MICLLCSRIPMSTILPAVRRIARARNQTHYEDLDENAESLPNTEESADYIQHIAEEIEMTSVSVVPDGMFGSLITNFVMKFAFLFVILFR